MSIIQNISDEMKSHPNCLHFASWGTGRRNIQNNLNKNINKEPFFHLQSDHYLLVTDSLYNGCCKDFIDDLEQR